MSAGLDPDLVEQVLCAVEAIPPGRVMSYGDVAELVGRGGPRQVGSVLSRHGSGVPWWRVVRADGRPAPGLAERALAQLAAEGAPLRGDRLEMGRARWRPGPGEGPDDLVGDAGFPRGSTL